MKIHVPYINSPKVKTHDKTDWKIHNNKLIQDGCDIGIIEFKTIEEYEKYKKRELK